MVIPPVDRLGKIASQSQREPSGNGHRKRIGAHRDSAVINDAAACWATILHTIYQSHLLLKRGMNTHTAPTIMLLLTWQAVCQGITSLVYC